jgi:RNA-directed DNA polymerase
MNSWRARVIAVHRISQDNQGKKTAGVDGVKSLTPKQRMNLVSEMKLGTKVRPTRRVWIDKPGTDEKRPLGIPTMYDRALQALVKQALEPEWEARLEPNSYGFRPGHSCNDVMEIDHIIPKSKGGKDEYKNLQLLHRHCHDTKSTTDKNQKVEIPEGEFKW